MAVKQKPTPLRTDQRKCLGELEGRVRQLCAKYLATTDDDPDIRRHLKDLEAIERTLAHCQKDDDEDGFLLLIDERSSVRKSLKSLKRPREQQFSLALTNTLRFRDTCVNQHGVSAHEIKTAVTKAVTSLPDGVEALLVD